MRPRADLFVTGTDTGVGKTLIAAALLSALGAGGLRAVGMKPVAAGLVGSGDGWVSEDAVMLARASSIAVPPNLGNPYAFRDAAAPNLAAAKEGRSIELAPIVRAFEALRAISDAVVVEGAGGFLVPLGSALDGGDLARTLGLPAVLVVGMRLGCVNHALLSAEAIRARGVRLAGWVANRIDPDMRFFDENVALLRDRLGAALLGVVPHLAEPRFQEAARLLELRPLLES